MVRLVLACLYTFFALSLPGAVSAAPGEPPRGKNEKLNIGFVTEGGSHWCGTSARVTLTAKTAKPLQNNTEEFQQMLGRIRGILQGECPQIRYVGFDGQVKGSEVSSGESAELTDWRYVPFSMNGKQVPCQGPSDVPLCDQRWSAYNEVRSLFLDPAFKPMKLTRFLTTDPGADVEFAYSDATGRVAFVPSAKVPFRTSSEFITQQIEQTSRQCSGRIALTEQLALEGQSALQGVNCEGRDEFSHTFFFIRSVDDGFLIIALSDFTPEGKSGLHFASQLQAKLQGRRPQGAWDAIVSDQFSYLQISNFVQSPCEMELNKFAKLDERPVAVRLRQELQGDAGMVAFTVLAGKNDLIKDAWRMRMRNLTSPEKDLLQPATLRAIWLVFKVVESGGLRQFENQLFVTNSATSCVLFRGPNLVTVENMPQRAVELYTNALNLGQQDMSADDSRRALTRWGASGR